MDLGRHFGREGGFERMEKQSSAVLEEPMVVAGDYTSRIVNVVHAKGCVLTKISSRCAMMICLVCGDVQKANSIDFVSSARSRNIV